MPREEATVAAEPGTELSLGLPQELTDEERRQFAALPFDPDAFMRTAGVATLTGESGYSPIERVWARPSCAIRNRSAVMFRLTS